MRVLSFGNKLNREVYHGFIFANLFNSLYLSVRLWWNILVAILATNFLDLVAKVKNLVTLAPVLGAISCPAYVCEKIHICWLHNNSFFLFFLLFCVELIFIETASYPGSPYLGDFHHGQQWGIECDIWRGMFFVSGRSCLCVCSFRPLCITQPLIWVGFVCQYVWHVYMTFLLNWMSTATVVALFLLIKFNV